MSEITLGVIVERIDNLCTKVEDGFKGVHDRQDRTNGNVKINTEWRLENKKPVNLVSNITTIIITAVVVSGLSFIIHNAA